MARNRLWISEKERQKDLTGNVYIVTGANSGVGLETTRQLIKQGGHVIMACRRENAAQEVAASFSDLKGSYDVLKLDLADLQSVRDFTKAFLGKYDRLDGLVCNAGMAVDSREIRRTKDGFELSMGVSYFGHFLLTELLLDVLKQSVPSRVVLLSSVVHAGSEGNRVKLVMDDLNYEKRPYKNFQAYAEAKLAVVLYAMELGNRLEGTGVTTYSVHPGWARSNFGGNGAAMRVMRVLMKPLNPLLTDSNEESAQTSLHCLLSDSAPRYSGQYFSQSSVLYRDKEYRAGGWPMKSPNPKAHDMKTARELVKLSYKLVGLK